jgi:hypothetical protein
MADKRGLRRVGGHVRRPASGHEGVEDVAVDEGGFASGDALRQWILTESRSEFDFEAGLGNATAPVSSMDGSVDMLGLSLELRAAHENSLTHSYTSFQQGDDADDDTVNLAVPTSTSSLEVTPVLPPSCACLSTLYLALNDLQTMDTECTFPYSLQPLRDATQTAETVLQCIECSKRFISAMQSTQLMGALLVSIAERFSKVLSYINHESSRVSLASETKQFRLADMNHIAAFSIDLSAEEWRSMCKKVVRAEVACLVNVAKQMKERQRRWHQNPTPVDSPKDEHGVPIGRTSLVEQHGQGEYLCLRLVFCAEKVIGGLDWS